MRYLKTYQSFNESLDNYCFKSGDCDIYAIALHRLHGYPIYVVNGYYKEDDWNEEMGWTEMLTEPAHLCVKLPNGNYMDCDGEVTEEQLKKQCGFSNKIEYIKIEPISEEEAMELYSYEEDKDEHIQTVMSHIKESAGYKEYKVGDIIISDGNEPFTGDNVFPTKGKKYQLIEHPLDDWKHWDRSDLDQDYIEEENDIIDGMKDNWDNVPPIPENDDGLHRIIAANELGLDTILMWKQID